MDLVDLIAEKQFLGREFLTWIWFTNEVENTVKMVLDDFSTEIEILSRLKLGSIVNDSQVVISDSDTFSRHRAIRTAIRDSKMIDTLTLVMTTNEMSWRMSVDSLQLSLSGLKFPKMDAELDGAVDKVYERTAILTRIYSVFDALLLTFLKLRISDDWSVFRARMNEWCEQDG